MSSEIVGKDGVASGPEADDPALMTGRRLAELLRGVLHPSIKAFEKKVLATFDWDGQGKGKQSTSVVLKEVKAQKGAGTVNLTLSWKPSSGKEIDVPASVSVVVTAPRQQRPSVFILLKLDYGSRSLTLARGENILKWDRGEKLVSVYPYLTGAVGVERAGQTWFPRDPTDTSIARETGFVGGARHPLLDPYWPRFHEEEGWRIELPPLPTGNESAEGWGKYLLAFAIWAMLVQPFQQSPSASGEASVDPTAYGLPPVASYWPQRAVTLDPNRVYAELSKSLLLPWHLVAAACASLNAGKHVIFTGPPGCGKSKLAIALARMVRNAEPVIATASPSWTAGDLVGRYLPRRDGKGLEFKPGFFLRAVEANRCLVIDEFNRANIDQCFGELFAVFAGDPVELPFEQAIEGRDAPEAALQAAEPPPGASATAGDGTEVARVEAAPPAPKERYATVRILPATYSRRHGFRPEEEGVVYRDYKVSPEFRLIGTMNDADRAQLHQLSFALLRRFDVIRVEAPAPDQVRDFIGDQVAKIADSLSDSAYQFDGLPAKDLLQRLRTDYLDPIFANVNLRPEAGGQPFADLVAERAVGLATVEDILRFLAEGLRCPSSGSEKIATAGIKEPGIAAAASYLAMGLVLSVFPQLDALDDARRWAAIEHIIDVFHRDGKGAPFVHIEGKRDDKTGRVSYQLVKPSARSFRPKDIDKNNEISIAEYLIGELSLQYKDITEEAWHGLVVPAGAP